MSAIIAAAFAACASEVTEQALVTPESSAGADVVTVETSCGAEMDPPRFTGQVVGRMADGATRPLGGVSFFRGIAQFDVENGLMRSTDIITDVNGRFEAIVSIGSSSSIWERRGKVFKTQEWVEDVVFELRAPDCDNLVVHFSMQWKPQILVMSCPGREGVVDHES